MTREFPPSEMGKVLFESTKPFRDSLGLDTLENGYDLLEIRIWMLYMHKQQVIMIRNKKGSWDGASIKFHPVANKKMDTLLYVEKEITPLRPKVSWNDLYEKLVSYNVLTLPDEGKLANYVSPIDGFNLAVEISSRNNYRMYSYTSPDMNLRIPAAKNMDDILKYIKTQFNINMVY